MSSNPRPHASFANRLTLTRIEAAMALGVSTDFFDEHVVPHIRMLRIGRRRLIPVREIERFIDKHAHSADAAIRVRSRR